MEALAKPCVREWLCVHEGARINPVSNKIGVFLLKFERENDRARKVTLAPESGRGLSSQSFAKERWVHGNGVSAAQFG